MAVNLESGSEAPRKQTTERLSGEAFIPNVFALLGLPRRKHDLQQLEGCSTAPRTSPPQHNHSIRVGARQECILRVHRNSHDRTRMELQLLQFMVTEIANVHFVVLAASDEESFFRWRVAALQRQQGVHDLHTVAHREVCNLSTIVCTVENCNNGIHGVSEPSRRMDFTCWHEPDACDALFRQIERLDRK